MNHSTPHGFLQSPNRPLFGQYWGVSEKINHYIAHATWRGVMRSRDEKTKAKMAELIFNYKPFSGLDRKTFMQMICVKLD